MARIRTIKPEFFQHESLFEAEESSGLPLRLAFIGLWTQCDRAGRFEWRPRQLKLNVLPYDSIDFPAVLSVLETHGFIRRYDVDGKSYGCIPSWEKHQYINSREPSSTLPAPDGTCTGTIPVSDEASTGTIPSKALREGKGTGKEGKGTEAHALARATPGLDATTWERWREYRRTSRKPIIDASAEAAAKALAKFGADQAAVVEQSIANGWQGLFPVKHSGLNGAAPTRQTWTPDDDEPEASRAQA